MKKTALHILLILSLISFGYSQGSDVKTDSVYNNVFEDVSVYKNFNEVYLGNYGLAKYSLTSPFNDNSSKLYSFFNKSKKDTTYTDLFFTTGSGKEGIISVNHNQHLGKRIKANLSLTQTSSEGFYLQQKASIGVFNANINYLSKNERYEFTLRGDFYKRKNQLNGGINDSAFVFYYENDGLRLLYPINLSDANLQKNKRELDFTHNYKIYKDSNGTFSLSQQFNYYTEKLRYSDGLNTFYTNYYQDSLGDLDTLKLEFLTHNLLAKYKLKNIEFYTGISNSYADYKADSVFIPSMIHSVLAGVNYKKNKFNLASDFSYTFSGFLKGNMFTKNYFNYENSNFFFDNINAYAEYSITTPQLYHYQYFSNHLKWDNNLNLEHKLALNVNAISSKLEFEVGGEYQTRENFVYYNEFALVSQTNISFAQIHLAKDFKVTNWLHFIPKFYYQKVISNQNISLPEIVSHNRIYGEGRLFKKILTFRVGVDVLYYTDFYAKAYNPSFDNFYIQNSTLAGSYPFVDFFAEFYSKNNLAFFVKATHANYGLMGTSYLASPNYRQQDRTINFGVKWRLYN